MRYEYVGAVRSHSTYSGKTLRRSIITIGLMSLALLIFQTGWEATKAVNSKNDREITITSITLNDIQNGDIWFDALVQVLYSTNIGIGLLPVITGKFIYKGDAVRYVLIFFIRFIILSISSIIVIKKRVLFSLFLASFCVHVLLVRCIGNCFILPTIELHWCM